MSDAKEGGRNVADYQTVKDDIYNAYTQFETSLNAYQDPRVRSDWEQRQKLLSRIRRSLLALYGKAKPSHNIQDTTGDKIKECRRNLMSRSWEENCEHLEELYYLIADSMGEQGFLDTRLDEDQTKTFDDDIPEMFK